MGPAASVFNFRGVLHIKGNNWGPYDGREKWSSLRPLLIFQISAQSVARAQWYLTNKTMYQLKCIFRQVLPLDGPAVVVTSFVTFHFIFNANDKATANYFYLMGWEDQLQPPLTLREPQLLYL